MSRFIEYRKYRPRAAARETIDQANSILEASERAGWGTMTLRQLYYQFVAADLIENSEKSYKRLGRIITDARYGGLVSWTAIEDVGRTSYGFSECPTMQEVLDGIQYQLNIDPWLDQPCYVEVWVEKQALESTIEVPSSKWQVPYMATKGYISASEAWRGSLRFAHAQGQGKKCVLFHLGDHDPSGIDMTRDNDDRLKEFIGPAVNVKRLALNMDQVKKYSPPPNFAKEDDSRYPSYKKEFGDKSWELDALKQQVIADMISNAIAKLVDKKAWEKSMKMQEKRRKELEVLQDNINPVRAYLSKSPKEGKLITPAVLRKAKGNSVLKDIAREIEKLDAS